MLPEVKARFGTPGREGYRYDVFHPETSQAVQTAFDGPWIYKINDGMICSCERQKILFEMR